MTAAASEDPWDSAALRRQDAAAFAQLYADLAPALLRYLIRLCGDPALAEDLLQDTFVKAYRALPHTRAALQPRPWLYAIATNTARSATRTAAWRRVLRLSDQDVLDRPMAFSLESRYAEADLVERALAAIKPDYAAPLLLHWREGFSLAEVCAILGLSQANLKKRLYRAKQAFARAYHEECRRAEEGGWG